MNKILACFTAFFLTLFVSGVCLAQPAIEEIEGIALEAGIFDAVDDNHLLLLSSSADAQKHFSKENFEKLSEAVNFETQRVLVFAWRGSGGDRISYFVAESWPEQISFQFTRGMTRDLATHQKIFALRSNVSCEVQGNAVDLNPVANEEYIRIEMRGTLQVQNDTGYTLTANGFVVELDFDDSHEFKELANGLDGETIMIAGNLELKANNGDSQPWKLVVTDLTADD